MASCGSDMRLQVFNEGVGEWVFVDTRSDGVTTNNEQVDITDKNGMPWRTLINCGLRSNSISSSGVFYSDNDQTMEWLTKQAMESPFIQARILFAGFQIYASGEYQIASFERTGEYNSAEEFSMTLESAGITVIDTILPADLPQDMDLLRAVGTVRLTDNFTGPLVRVRRDLDNAESDIQQVQLANSLWVVDVAEAAAFGSGTPVYFTVWYDQMGFGNFQQTAIADQPLFLDAGGTPVDFTPSGIPCGQFSTNEELDAVGIINWNTFRKGAMMGYIKPDFISDQGVFRASDEKFGISLTDAGFNGTPGVGYSRGNRQVNIFANALSAGQDAVVGCVLNNIFGSRYRCSAGDVLYSETTTRQAQGLQPQLYRVGGLNNYNGPGCLGMFWGDSDAMSDSSFDAYFNSMRAVCGV